MVLFGCEQIPAMGAPAAVFIAEWRNPPRGRRCVVEYALGMTLCGGIYHGDDAKMDEMLLAVV
jgi:hypothetical protein